MADKKHRTHFDITATDSATRVFKTVEGGLTSLQTKYLAVGTAAVAAFEAGGVAAFVADAVRYRAALDDLADTTGDNVRTLDGMARQARISGLEVERLGDILTKFARNLNAADDEGKDTAQAIEAIGLSVEQLRALKPAEALFEISKAMAQFADSQSKVAVANALAKGSAKELLPYLKDLAEAGELSGKITAEQAAQAERLEKEWRKLTQAFRDSKDELATFLIPKIADLVEQMREGIRIAGGFGAAIRLFGLGTSPFGSPREQIAGFTEQLEALQAGRARRENIAGFDPAMYDKEIRELQKKIEFLKFLERQNALSGRTGPETLDARDLRAQQKPTLSFVPGKPPAAEEKSPRLTPEKIAQMQAAAQEEFNEQTQRYRREQIEAEKKLNDELTRQRDHYLDLIDPLRKFQREWEQLDELRRRGLLTEDQYLDAYVKVAEAADKARLEVEGLNDETKKSKNAFAEMGFTATSALEELIIKGGQARDVLAALWQDLARIILRRQVLGPLAEGIGTSLDKLFATPDKASTGDFSAGGGFEGVDWEGQFATGGSFTVGGRGGTDTQLVAFRATPGERVDVSAPGQPRSAKGVVVVQQTNNFAVGVRGEVRAELAMHLPRIAAASRAAVNDARQRGRA